jgi:cysteine desulfurase family protein
MIYLDNAATAFPRPREVVDAVSDFLANSAANPGRSGHRLSLLAGEAVEDARRKVARSLGVPKPSRIAFAFNATDALNMALFGFLHSGDHVVSTAFDHNSVSRPLSALERDRRISVTRIAPRNGLVDPSDVRSAMIRRTRLVVLNHASNVTGALQDARAIARAAHEGGALLLLDAAQTAGICPILADEDGIDLLAFTGHKGLLGPTGTGGLFVREGVDLEPYRTGGSGNQSESEEMPPSMPDRLEAGTLNAAGIVGLGAGAEWLSKRPPGEILAHEQALVSLLERELGHVPGVKLYGPPSPEHGTGVLSFTVDGIDPSELTVLLDGEFGIATRAGLHCAPWMHRALGTFPSGTVRVSFGPFNTEEEAKETVRAVKIVAKNVR